MGIDTKTTLSPCDEALMEVDLLGFAFSGTTLSNKFNAACELAGELACIGKETTVAEFVHDMRRKVATPESSPRIQEIMQKWLIGVRDSYVEATAEPVEFLGPHLSAIAISFEMASHSIEVAGGAATSDGFVEAMSHLSDLTIFLGSSALYDLHFRFCDRLMENGQGVESIISGINKVHKGVMDSSSSIESSIVYTMFLDT